MLQEYLPVLIFLGVATGIGLVLLGLGFLIGHGRKDYEKLSPYDCGFEPFDDSRTKFDVRILAKLFYPLRPHGIGFQYSQFHTTPSDI